MRRVLPLILSGLLLTGTTIARAQEEPERTHTTEHFSITWVDDPSDPSAPDLTDNDGNGVPDGVERMAEAFEEARAFLLGDLGYQSPPVAERYLLYVADPGGLGYTQPVPGGIGRSQPSFIVIPPGYVRSTESQGVMRLFAIHEYFHAVQIGYDSQERDWIMEASSAWVEDLFVDALDDNRFYLPNFLLYPRSSLSTSGGGHEYGAFLFLQFLTERYAGGSEAGASIVRELWELMAVPEAIPGAPDLDPIGGIVEVLARRGTTLEAAWGEFLLWQRRLGHFEEGASYRVAMAGSDWPTLLRSTAVRTESCTMDTGREVGLPPLSGDYIALRPHKKGPRSTTAILAARGPIGSTGFYVLRKKGRPAEEHLLNFDASGVVREEVEFGSRQLERILVGLGNGAPSEEEAAIAYSLRIEDRGRVETSNPRGTSVTQYGTAVTLSGNVTCGGKPAPFADVVVTETAQGSGARRTFATSTNENGAWSIKVTPEQKATYAAEVVDPLLSSATSTEDLVVDVRVFVSLELMSIHVPTDEPLNIAGEVIPAHPGVPVVIEYRRPERAWQTGVEILTDESSRYTASVVLPGTGIWEVRARVTSTNDDDHVPGSSITEFVEVGGF